MAKLSIKSNGSKSNTTLSFKEAKYIAKYKRLKIFLVTSTIVNLILIFLTTIHK